MQGFVVGPCWCSAWDVTDGRADCLCRRKKGTILLAIQNIVVFDLVERESWYKRTLSTSHGRTQSPECQQWHQKPRWQIATWTPQFRRIDSPAKLTACLAHWQHGTIEKKQKKHLYWILEIAILNMYSHYSREIIIDILESMMMKVWLEWPFLLHEI